MSKLTLVRSASAVAIFT